MPFNVSEEQSLLASMISERDAHISSLTHQLHSTGELLQSTQRELQHKSASRRAQREEHSATIKKLKEEHSEQRRVLAKFEQNVKSGGGLRVHEYAALMRSANSNQVESTYVVRLQAQLCRAMHSLGVMESQLALVKENCSSLIKFMKEDLSHMVDDRTRREIELMNGLARADGEKRVMAQEMAQKVKEREELLDQVREEYEELGLEYDENEVKQALEVKYLLEQMAKVQEDKVRLEKELLAALLEREEQIEKLRGETEGMGEKLEGLKKEVEERDRQYAVSGTGEDADAGEAEENEEGAEATADGEAEGEEDISEEDTPDTDGGEAEEEPAAEEEVAAVASQLENAAINGEEDAPSDSAATDDASHAELLWTLGPSMITGGEQGVLPPLLSLYEEGGGVLVGVRAPESRSIASFRGLVLGLCGGLGRGAFWIGGRFR
ncbi:hypothetical protein ACHAXT_001517 [Thalassiosira profunda]